MSGAIAGSSRYLQYRGRFGVQGFGSPPSVRDVTIGYSEIRPNRAPIAADDTFNGTEDTPLMAAAPGVLANDTDADGDPLTAILVTGPGTLALNGDGSFVYTPAPGFTGTDSFIYRAIDEVHAFTLPTIVTITVQ